MPSADNALRHNCRAYTAAVDLAAVRAWVKASREARGWTLDQLAEKSGVNRSTIHDVETNSSAKTQFETVNKLVEALGFTISVFSVPIAGLPSAIERDYDPRSPRSTSDNREATAHDSPPVPSALSEYSVLLSMGDTIADAIDRGFDRVAAILTGQQTATSRVGTTKRPARNRASRR